MEGKEGKEDWAMEGKEDRRNLWAGSCRGDRGPMVVVGAQAGMVVGGRWGTLVAVVAVGMRGSWSMLVAAVRLVVGVAGRAVSGGTEG